MNSITFKNHGMTLGLSHGANWGFVIMDDLKQMHAQIEPDQMEELVHFIASKQDLSLIPDFKALKECKQGKKIIENQAEKIGNLIERNEELRDMLKGLSKRANELAENVMSGNQIDASRIPNLLFELHRIENELEA